MVIYIINSRTRKLKHFDIAMFLKFLFVGAINHRITNYCTSTRRPMKFFVGFWCFLYVFFSGLWITELFLVFVVMTIFRRQWFTTSVQKKFLMFFLPYHFYLIIDVHVWNFGVNSIYIFGFDYRVFWVTCTARWLAITSWVTSKTRVSPTILQLLFCRISLLRIFLIISFLVEIFDMRNSISLLRLVISFLSTTVWYSSWFCKCIFCFTSFCIKSLISFFILVRRTSLIFYTSHVCMHNRLLLVFLMNHYHHFQYHSKRKSQFGLQC